MNKVAFWPDWCARALCADPGRSDVDDRFFSEESSGGGLSDAILSAKATCLQCPVRRECLEYAYSLEGSKFRQGVFGGSTGEQRQAFAEFPDRVDSLLSAMELEGRVLGISPVHLRLINDFREGTKHERRALASR